MTTPPIIDGHNDTILRLYMAEEPIDFFAGRDGGHIDFPRIKAGGLSGGFFALYTPNQEKMTSYPGDKKDGDQAGYEVPLPPALDQNYALQYTVGMAAKLLQVERQSQGQMRIVRTAPELEQCINDGTFAIIFHIEGAEAIDTDLNALYLLHAAGLRSLGLVWSRPTAFGYGVPFRFPATPNIGPGLTDAGKALVRACNQLSILVDMSHLNEAGFWDVARISDAPLVTTHSGAHACSNSPRNLTDKQLDAIAESGGMTGVNFHVGFLREDGTNEPTTSLTEIVRHARYIADRIGVDHVGLGSDFDGATMPGDLKDVAGLPKLVQALRDGGFSEAEVSKITYQNWLRVLGKTWK